MKLRPYAIADVAASFLTAPVFAHHSFAMFHYTNGRDAAETVKSFKWTNPHMWPYVVVPQANGAPVEYPLDNIFNRNPPFAYGGVQNAFAYYAGGTGTAGSGTNPVKRFWRLGVTKRF